MKEKILIIEDDKGMQFFLSEALKKQEYQAYSDACHPVNCFFDENPIECPCLRKGDQQKSREQKPSVHKIPAPSDHEKSMKESGKKDQRSVFQVLTIFFQQKHQYGQHEDRRSQTALKQISDVLEALGPIGTGA